MVNTAASAWWHLTSSLYKNTFSLAFKHLLQRNIHPNTFTMWYLNVIKATEWDERADTDQSVTCLCLSPTSITNPGRKHSCHCSLPFHRRHKRTQEIIHTGLYFLLFNLSVLGFNLHFRELEEPSFFGSGAVKSMGHLSSMQPRCCWEY